MRLKTRPMCHVCRQPVASVDEDHDPFRCVVVFTVRCHGDTQKVQLPDTVTVVDFGTCFVPEHPELPA